MRCTVQDREHSSCTRVGDMDELCGVVHSSWLMRVRFMWASRGLAVVGVVGACGEVLDAKLVGRCGGVLMSCLYGWGCQYVGGLMGRSSDVLGATGLAELWGVAEPWKGVGGDRAYTETWRVLKSRGVRERGRDNCVLFTGQPGRRVKECGVPCLCPLACQWEWGA
jgi:hypothetical protein